MSQSHTWYWCSEGKTPACFYHNSKCVIRFDEGGIKALCKNNSPIEDIRFTTLIVTSKFLPEIIGAL
jgi:hypothetical protein